MDISFKSKKAIVTGASRGIGQAIALGLAANGCDVAICARGAESLKSAELKLRQYQNNVFGAVCDVGDGSAVARFVLEAAAALNGIDFLINNVSGIGLKDDESGWLTSLNVDLMATVRANLAAIPFMEEAGSGVIINISSIAGFMAMPRGVPYAAAKAALINYTMSQGLALAPKRIRVNAIAPGATEFPGGVWDERKISNPDLYRSTLERIPSGRFGTPEDIAKVALFLCSELASWITGQTIVVDGGQSLRSP